MTTTYSILGPWPPLVNAIIMLGSLLVMGWALGLARLRALCSDYRELFHAAIALFVLFTAWHWRYYLDPSIGFDGWSDVLYTLQRCFVASLVVLFAWMAKKAAHGETTEAQDETIRTAITTKDPRMMYVLDMLSTAFWVLVMCWLLAR